MHGTMFPLPPDDASFATYPGARAPDRRRIVDSGGIALAVVEWGDPTAPLLMLAHGAFDFARTFDRLAPMLADAGYRVVSWDQRGHGDSDHADFYSWMADERDMMAVIASTTDKPCIAVGHSKGGALLLHAVQAQPHRFSRFVSIDGLPFRPNGSKGAKERIAVPAHRVTEWLDHRQRASRAQRRPDTLEGLARRRAQMNPRLSHDWLCYLVSHGARRDTDGWRWKIDPALRRAGFGPYRWQWPVDSLPAFPIPMLALMATEPEPMGWDAGPADLAPYLPLTARLEVMPGVGHFIHIERPAQTAGLVLDFLRS
jgi:pimeloyl-ACP methyl ester carboxylesterase